MRVTLLWLIAAVAACYLAIIGLATAMQAKLIYPTPPVAQAPPGFSEIELRTDDGLAITSGYRPAMPGQATIVFFHGNGMGWPDAVAVTDLLAARGYGLLLAEYRGYNDNPGTPSEQGIYRDGRAALAFLESEGIAGTDVILAGLSVGSGPAVQLATERKIRALILISPMASLPATARALYPWLPSQWILRDRYDNIAKLPQVEAPVLILHGETDRLIPVSHAKQLAAARPGTEFVRLPGRGHNMAADPVVQQLQLAFLEEL